MKVSGTEVPTHIIDHALAGMELHRGFVAAELEAAIVNAGGQYPLGVASRATDRTLQKLRKTKAIEFRGGKWFAVLTPKE